MTKKDVPYLTSLIFNTSAKLVRRPKFYVGDFVRISKADLPFRKGYKQTFTNEVFEIYDIPTTNHPTYSLIDATQEPVKGKFYELELVKARDNSSEIKNMNEFTVFAQNTLSSFKNYFNEEINLEWDWRVALSEIIFPAKINQVNKSDLKIFSYEKRDHFLKSLKTATGLPHFDYQFNKITGILFLFFGKNEGITFPDNKIPSILGFSGIHDGSGYHIGYKMLETVENLTMADDEEKTFAGDYPFDLSAGKQLIFIYVNIIEYQYVGDTKAPLIRVIDSKHRLKNGSPCEIEPTHRIVFSNLEYKKLLSKNFQSIEIQLRTETQQLVPFAGTGKVILTLNFKKFD